VSSRIASILLTSSSFLVRLINFLRYIELYICMYIYVHTYDIHVYIYSFCHINYSSLILPSINYQIEKRISSIPPSANYVLFVYNKSAQLIHNKHYHTHHEETTELTFEVFLFTMNEFLSSFFIP